MTIYVLFGFNLFLVSDKNYVLIFPYGPILNHILWSQPSLISDLHKKKTFCKGQSKEHFSNIYCQMVLRLKTRMILTFFTIMSYVKFALWWQLSWISNQHNKLAFCKSPPNDNSGTGWIQSNLLFLRIFFFYIFNTVLC